MMGGTLRAQPMPVEAAAAAAVAAAAAAATWGSHGQTLGTANTAAVPALVQDDRKSIGSLLVG